MQPKLDPATNAPTYPKDDDLYNGANLVFSIRPRQYPKQKRSPTRILPKAKT